MDALWTLAERQYVLETKHARFLESLDAERTITLFQLLTRGNVPKELTADWLCPHTLTTRMKALADFLDRVTRRGSPFGWDRMPLVFFQSSPANEDDDELARRLAEDAEFPRARRYLPAQIAYLNGDREWTSTLRGTRRRAVIPPLCTFRASDVVGYRLPDFTTTLGRVTGATATNYVTRLVGYDVGSAVLPTDVPGRPHLHNVTMLNAMSLRTPKFADRWERSVSDECTDPMFFLNAALRINPGDAGKDLTRRHVYNCMYRTYVRDASTTIGLGGDPALPLKERRRRVQAVLDTMLADGYVRFAKAMKAAAVASAEVLAERDEDETRD